MASNMDQKETRAAVVELARDGRFDAADENLGVTHRTLDTTVISHSDHAIEIAHAYMTGVITHPKADLRYQALNTALGTLAGAAFELNGAASSHAMPRLQTRLLQANMLTHFARAETFQAAVFARDGQVHKARQAALNAEGNYHESARRGKQALSPVAIVRNALHRLRNEAAFGHLGELVPGIGGIAMWRILSRP